jgi:MFS family permease
MAAVLTLNAKPAELGLLAALSMGPGVIIGLFAGGLADRRRRRPLLIGADLARVLLLLSVPIAAWSHLLAMPQLYVVAALVGAASVLFDIADHAYLPSLLDREQLLDGNAKLGVTESVAEIGGPALAGVLFQWLTAPVALLANAGSYLVSALLLATIRKPEPPPQDIPAQKHPFEDLVFGYRAVVAQPLVRPLLAMTVCQSLFGSFFAGTYVLFGVKVLGLSTSLLGLTIAVGGIGALLGAFLAPLAVRILGTGPAIIGLAAISAAGALLIPLAPGNPVGGTAFLVASQLIGDAFAVAAMIPAATLRQSVFPTGALGRTGAVFHVARGGTAVIGALAGGLLAQVIGIREAMVIGALGMLIGPVIAWLSPLRRLKDMPGL